MRNRNHNKRGVLNTSNPDWHEDRGTYGHGYQNHGYDNDRGSDNFNYGDSYGYGSSIGGRYDNYGYDRDYSNRGNYGAQYTRDSGFNRGRYQGDRDEGFQGYNRSSYGNDYSHDYLNYGSERGANDRARDEYRRSDVNRNYQGGSNYGGGNYGTDYIRSRRGGDENDRGWWDRTSDEVSSWFGDEDAERRRQWDKAQSGQHRGKGPKGYKRSDDRIKEDINDRLSDDVFVDASEIEVTVIQGEVTLTGTVAERNEKRRAEDIAEQVSGVKNVENRIRLTQNESSGDRGNSFSQENSGVTSATTSSNRNKVKETHN